MDLRITISVSEFWQYSLQYYTQNNNQSTLLWLQDNAGLNVNIIILLMYLQTKNVFISHNEFNHLIKSIQNLDSLTSNFREKRRVLKAENMAKGLKDFRTIDYQALLHQELDLEKRQQTKLINEVCKLTKQNNDAEKHIDCVMMDIKYYLGSLTASINGVAISEFESHIDKLIKEQTILTRTFGQDLNE